MTRRLPAQIPHPRCRRPVRAAPRPSADGLAHTENAVHMQVFYRFAATPKLDVSVGLGPTFFSVKQDLIDTVDVAEPGPDHHATSAEVSDSPVGFNVGADATYMINELFGAGVLLRYRHRLGRHGVPIGGSGRSRCRRFSVCCGSAGAVLTRRGRYRSEGKENTGMMKKLHLVAVAGVLSAAVACSDDSRRAPPLPPVLAGGIDDAGAAADGSTLKVPAPTQVAPANGVDARVVRRDAADQCRDRQVHRQVAVCLPLSGPAERPGRDVTSALVDTRVEGRRSRRQRHLRLALPRGAGASSSAPGRRTWTFKTPDIPQGYIAGGEVYDPLWTGKSVGSLNGPVTFIPDVGAKMLDFVEQYRLRPAADRDRRRVLDAGHERSGQHRGRQDQDHVDGRRHLGHHDQRPPVHDREAWRPPGQIAWRMITRNRR